MKRQIMGVQSLAAAVLGGWGIASGAVQVTYDIPVTDMGEFAVSGSPQIGSDFAANVQWGSIGESRVVLEFDLGAVSSAAVLQSATLNYHLNELQTADFGQTGPVVSFFAYGGDGVATIGDTGAGTLVGTSPEFLNNGAYSQPLLLPTVQSILDTGPDALGLRIWSDTPNNLGAGFHWNANPTTNQPVLSLVADIQRQGTVSGGVAADAQASFDNGAWSLDPASAGLTVSRWPLPNGPDEERAIIEFAAPTIPTGAMISGGRLRLDTRFISISSTGVHASVLAHLYAGDGVAELTDIGALTLPAARSADIVSGTQELVIDLNRQGLQAAYDLGLDFVGTLLSYAPDNFLQADFYSQEGAAASTFFNAPVLELDYFITDGATPGDANLDEVVDLVDADILVSAYTGALAAGAGDALWLDGDFDQDGDVDFADAMALRRNFGADLAALDARLAAIPEPMVGLLCVGIVACRGKSRRECSRA